jgi:hypothetical protein
MNRRPTKPVPADIAAFDGGQRAQGRGRELSVYVQQLDATWESAREGMGLG